MTVSTNINSSFEIDIKKWQSLGLLDHNAIKDIANDPSVPLTSNERLYLGLLNAKELGSVSFEAKKTIFSIGEPISAGYFVVSGQLLAVNDKGIQRLGPGSVIGLAEGLIGMHSDKRVMTVTSVQVRVISLYKIDAIIPRLPIPVREMIKNMVKRVLDLKNLPSGVL